ncbi:TonB-dependent receptor [Sphingobium algorifonticola]|uniref:TonB-dependent receptor n=1 Tax=Sphingobium algorifonticola TaxID=2008318 RepID=A0A437JCE2_9SPHN|nr:TonB-dependent receptor [Sphingobium algorifonticola]RVT43589.1 TonB-dependent receptor [Sphingobium algorifonticola]
MILRKGAVARHIVSGSALALALSPFAAQAQDAGVPAVAPAPEDAYEDAIVVTGSIVAAQGASIDAKRRADNLVDIAAADSVGRFPDQNSAAALARLPSVAVQRDQGQERYIQVRGAPNRWTSVSVDGIPVIGVDEGGETRAYRFDAIPAVLLSAIAINKSLTPNIQSEAIVANIDLRTYSPMAEKGLHIQGDVGYGFMELGKGEQRQASLRASWSNDIFGIVIGGSHYRRKQVTDNREVGLYDANGPTELDIRNYQLLRENNGLFAGIEYAPVEGQRFYAKTIYTEFNDDEQRHQYEFRLDRALSGTRSLSGGDLVRVPVRGTFNYGEYRTRNYINTVGGDFDTDTWDASFAFNYTRTENTTYLPLVQASTATATSPSLSFDFSNPNFPIVSLFQTVPGTTPGSFVRGPALSGLDQTTVNSGAILIPAVQDTFSDSYTVKFDVSREFEGLTLSAGGLYADRRIDGYTFATSNVINLATAPATVGLSFAPGSYVTGEKWDTGFPLGITLNYVDNVRMRKDVDAILDALQAAGRYNPATNVPVTNRYNITENLLAGYAMSKFEFAGGQVVAGVRVEHMKLGNVGTGALANGTLVPLSEGQSYTDVFPSVNARFDLSDDLVLRLAGQRGIARPSFGQIRVSASINDTTSPGTIGGGNPLLKPEYTWGLDGSVEYYLPGSGILSLSGFYRWVDNVLYSTQQIAGTDAYNSNGVDRSRYLLVSTFNGDKGYLYGIELNYQQQLTFLPGALDGFGFQGNITYLDGAFDTADRKDIGFPGTSDIVANASLYYEKYGLSARISYQWRGDWLETLTFGTGAAVTGDEYRKGYENLDVALRYQINPNFTLFADLSNLTDATYSAYQGTEARPTEVEQIGRRYLFGVRFGF